MYTLLSCLLSCLTSFALAANHEINLEAGWLASPEPGWDLYAPSDLYGTGGVRVGYALDDHFTAIVGWQHGQTGMFVGTVEPAGDQEGFRTGFYGETLTGGVKADFKLFKWLHPYATLQGAMLVATVRIDDDRTKTDNVTQVQRSGVTGGGLLTAGLDFPIALGSTGLAIAPYTELGYGVLAPVRFGELGTIQMYGFTGRTGIGLRF